ncbi:MAG TPA: hypothetical protein VGC55_01050 [Dokdonella sp.]
MFFKAGALALAVASMAACHRGASKEDIVQAANIPAGFDVTLLAEKDTQFDFDGAPLNAQDLQSAFRYRQEEKLPMATVLLKRGEKQKVKSEYIIALARIAYVMKFKAYVEDDGVISEIRAQAKEPEAEPAKPEPAKKEHAQHP